VPWFGSIFVRVGELLNLFSADYEWKKKVQQAFRLYDFGQAASRNLLARRASLGLADDNDSRLGET